MRKKEKEKEKRNEGWECEDMEAMEKKKNVLLVFPNKC